MVLVAELLFLVISEIYVQLRGQGICFMEIPQQVSRFSSTAVARMDS